MTKTIEAALMGARRGPQSTLLREVYQGLVVLALAGSSVGGLLGMIAIATRALGR